MKNKPPSQELSPAQLEAIARMFQTLAEPTRLQILHTLGSGEHSVSDLIEALNAKQANISKQLGILFQAGMVKKRREGNSILYDIADPMIFELCNLVCGKIKRDAESAVSRLSGKPLPR